MSFPRSPIGFVAGLTVLSLLSCGPEKYDAASTTTSPLSQALSLAVSWRVMDAGGGTIGSDGMYTAPTVAGTYHIVASLASNPSISSAPATISVSSTSSPPPSRPLGVNLGWVNGSHPDQIFANALKNARAWTIAGGDTLAPMGSDGWPAGSDLRIGFSEGHGQARVGGYKLRFRGSVTSYTGSGGVTITNSIFDGTWTTADLAVTDQNAWIEFRGATRIGGGAGITDVSLMRPGHALTTDHFNKQFVAAAAPFSLIRAMQAGGPGLDLYGSAGTVGVMGNRDTTWSSRQKPRVAYAYNGPAWEEWILLANLLGKDLWINIPFHVDATYIQKLANLIKYGSDGVTGEPLTAATTHDPSQWTIGTTAWFPSLAAGRKVYVEFGNELWNVGYGYPNSSEVQPLYQSEIAAGDPHHLNWDGAGGTDRWVAWKTVWISNLFRQVWGSEMQSTIRIVLPTQGDWGNWARADSALQYINGVWGGGSSWATIDGMSNPRQPVNYYIRTVAGSFYIHYSGQVSVTNADTAFQALNGSLNGPTSESNTVKQRIDYGETRAAQYGVTFSCYEGGTEVTSPTSDWTSYWYSDPRMKTLLKAEMTYFFSKPHAEVYTHFMMLENNTFGLSYDYADTSGQRWQAVREIAAGQ